jgi:hypothetical protein
MSAAVFDCVVHLFVREGHASLGVDVQASRLAPAGESVGVNCYLLDKHPLPSHVVAEIFGLLEPFFPGVGKLVRVFHDGHDTGIVFTSIPGNAGGAGLNGHGGILQRVKRLWRVVYSAVQRGFSQVGGSHARP